MDVSYHTYLKLYIIILLYMLGHSSHIGYAQVKNNLAVSRR